MSAQPVRDLAHGVLSRVEAGGKLDVELDAARVMAAERDRPLLAEMVRGTLQWRGRYDHLIRRFSTREPPADPALCDVLRLGMHQLFGLDGVPAHAALNETGELCRRKIGSRSVGFVNGLLQTARRRIYGEGLPPVGRPAREQVLLAWFDDLGPGSSAHLAAWNSHPLWLVERWQARFGSETTLAICAWNNQPVPLTLHVRAPCDPQSCAVQLRESGIAVTEHGACGRALVVGSPVDRAALVRLLAERPDLIVQDATVQEATTWLCEAAVGAADAKALFVDLCAAPGGKTAHLAGVWPGQLLAIDRTAERVRLLDDTMKRIGAARVGVVVGDARRPPLAAGSCAAVLVDGPCSGTGVMRHHPEGRWRLGSKQLRRSGERLEMIARSAWELLRPGGRLLYATCSLEPEENEAVIERLLGRGTDLVPAPDAEGRWQRLWLPHEARGDGFFAASLIRKG